MFASKGEAKPSDATKPVESPLGVAVEQVPPLSLPAEGESNAAAMASPIQQASALVGQPANLPMATKSLTVKVDVATYGKLKAHGGALGGKTNQDIFIEALVLYFNKYGVK